MVEKQSKNGGCFKIVLLIIGNIFIISPLNPLIQWKTIGEEIMLTNVSWLFASVMVLIYSYVIVTFVGNDKQ